MPTVGLRYRLFVHELTQQFKETRLGRAGKPAGPVGVADGSGTIGQGKVDLGQNVVLQFVGCLLLRYCAETVALLQDISDDTI